MLFFFQACSFVVCSCGVSRQEGASVSSAGRWVCWLPLCVCQYLPVKDIAALSSPIAFFFSVGIGNCCITVKFTLYYSLFWKHLGKLDHFRFPISEFHCNINHYNTSDTLGRSWKFDESLCLMEFVSCLRLNSFFFYNRFYIWTYVRRSLIHLRKFKVKVRLLLKKIPAKYPDNQTVRCRCLRRSTS